MTQAPIKPIITPTQIEEYKKAIDALDEAKVLVVIGYSLGEADDHINACILCIRLTEGVLFSHGTRYDIDFTE